MSYAASLKRRRVDELELSELGKVRIRRLSASQMMAFAQEAEKAERAGDNEAKEAAKQKAMRDLVRVCLVDDSDREIFSTDAEVLDLDWTTLKALIDACVRCNHLSMEEAKKNSQTAPSSG